MLAGRLASSPPRATRCSMTSAATMLGAAAPPRRRWPGPTSHRCATYLAIHWRRSAEEAKELAQEFFRSMVERGLLESYDPRRARLRT